MAIHLRTSSVQELLRPHASVLVDATTPEPVGRGWRKIISELFAAWAASLGATHGARLRVSSVRGRAGGLCIVADATSDFPFHRADLDDVRRLQVIAEREALRTCDVCGRRGVLRAAGDAGFATRCDRHADVAIARTKGIPKFLAEEVVMNLMTSHADWIDDVDAVNQVPGGWIQLLVEAFVRLGRLPRLGRFRLLDMRPVCGRLDMQLEHDLDVFDLHRYLEWRTALLALGDAALFTCDVCGAPGRLRPTNQCVPAPRCDAHCDYERWYSRQWSTSAAPHDPLVVLDSRRPQWTLEACRAAAKPPGPMLAMQQHADKAFALYDIRDIGSALGLAHDGGASDGGDSPRDTEHQSRLRALYERGESGSWRDLARPDHAMVDALDALAARAPHLRELSSFVRRHLLAAIHMTLPITLPPIMLVGEPGIGKSWFLSGLASVFRVPFRSHPMSGASHSDGIGGAHPVWRNSQIGLVAKTLLGETVANPLLLVDEFDKVPPQAGVDDLYRPFYSLLEPVGARRFVDAYLQFPIDASGVLWVFAGNGTANIPEPILDRLIVIGADSPGADHLAVIAASIYSEANARRRGFFRADVAPALVASLIGLTPRGMRIAIEHAMTTAGSEGRREITEADLPGRKGKRRPRVGFL